MAITITQNYRKIKATYLYTLHTPPLANGVLVLDNNGKVLEVAQGSAYAAEEVEYYEGIICPGFINAHCHLELSHLLNAVSKHTGLTTFLQHIPKLRDKYTTVAIKEAINQAYQNMQHNGIVGVGDISNTAHSFPIKNKGDLQIHTFVELLGLPPSRWQTAIKGGQAMLAELTANASSKHSASLSAHAPYTASTKLLQAIDNINQQHKEHGANSTLLSIHHQESEAEAVFFNDGSGDFRQLYAALKMDTNNFFIPPKTSSLQYLLEHLPHIGKILLVHNTFSTKQDIDIALAEQYRKEVYWCFCPKANLYIENRLPNISLFSKQYHTIVLGTDSLASNNSLDILSEMFVLQQHFPTISLQTLLTWACLNGAIFFNWSHLGSFETGKRPGVNFINHITTLANGQHKLTAKSKVQVLT